jgi:hypothetical protein
MQWPATNTIFKGAPSNRLQKEQQMQSDFNWGNATIKELNEHQSHQNKFQ